ncbi:MAG: class I SAM-dependent methyltransferase [Promethearchaeota archaeon]|nr:MAG: class I SAM-dependent methyltransferase [Candidatus Lokiarchaeota archaeon]
MYEKFAEIYDLIYQFKDYKSEVAKLKKIIKDNKKSEGNDLLDIACGTAEHLKYLKKDYNCVGVDINENMLTIAKEKLPDVTFIKSNMLDLNLNKTFDIIICLFSSIGYLRTYKNLKKAIQLFNDHLKKGGIIVIEPWFTRSVFREGSPGMTTYEDDTIKIARLNDSKVKENLSIMNMHYLIARLGEEVEYFKEKHILGLFEIDKTLQIFEDAGLSTVFLDDGFMKERGLFIAQK